MRRIGFSVIAIVAVTAFAVSGCSTVPKQYKEEISGIKTKVDTLESRVETVESKQAESERVVAEQVQVIEEIKVQKQQMPKTNISVLSRTGAVKKSTKDIQAALKNAGFYDGKIDGIKGSQTRTAIKAFQNANGLRADGVVGPRTWELLSRYLSAGAPTAGGARESAD